MVFSSFKSLRYVLEGMGHLPGRKSMMFFSDYLPVQDQEPSAGEQTKILAGETENSHEVDKDRMVAGKIERSFKSRAGWGHHNLRSWARTQSLAPDFVKKITK